MKLVTQIRKGILNVGESTIKENVTNREASSSYCGKGKIKAKSKDIKRKRVQKSLERVEEEFFSVIRMEEAVRRIEFCRAERAARQREERRAKRKPKD